MPNSTQNSGKLIYLIGASGAGKDTVLEELRASISDANTLIAHRYVFRQNEHNAFFENQISLTADEFSKRSKNGFFAMEWHAHSASYGIGSEIDIWLNAGKHVIVNGSRQYLTTMHEKYPDACVVALVVDDDVLRARLKARGRESQNEIEERIARNTRLSKAIPENAVCVDNSGELKQTILQFTDLLSNLS